MAMKTFKKFKIDITNFLAQRPPATATSPVSVDSDSVDSADSDLWLHMVSSGVISVWYNHP